MGAAIPICLTLISSLPDILPHGPIQIRTEVLTGTVQVRDEVVPEDADEDISYVSRRKSTVNATLIVDDGVNETRPAKRHALGKKGQKKGRGKEDKREVVVSEPDQDDTEVV